MRQENSTPTAEALSISPEPQSDHGEQSASPLLQSARPLWSETPPSFARSARRRSSGLAGRRSNNMRDRAIDNVKKMYERLSRSWASMTGLQRIGTVLAGIVSISVGLGFMILTGKLFEWLEPVAEDWEKSAPAYIVLWLLTVLVSFPPLVGWSTIGTVCGFLFGLWKGWILFTFGSVVGSTCSFVVSRTVLSGFVHRLMERDKRFAALALTLKYDGLKLLCMIRLCPLPYSICNGAVSTFPTVNPLTYGLATAIISPKFLIPTFVGSRLRVLTRDNEQMSAGSKAVNVISLLVSIGIGIFTGVYIYRRTLARAQQLEEQERAARRRPSHADPTTSLPPPSAFTDDAEQAHLRDEEERVGFHDDAVALDMDDDNVAFDSAGYRDEFTDNGSDVFDDGDGQGAEESYTLHRHVESR